MSLDIAATKPHDRLAHALSDDMARVNDMIRTATSAVAAPQPTCCGTINQAYWSAITCFRGRSS